VAKKQRSTARLPKAPLAEVIFELRWALQGGPQGQAILQSDPGLLPLIENFTSGIKKAGFVSAKDMSHPLQTGPHGVARRFFKAPDEPFPIMQIGPGIFASNESSEYDWKDFRKQVERGLRVLLKAYPKLGFFSLVPNQIELRYVDVFAKSLVGDAALFSFLKRGTSLKIGFPPMLQDDSNLFAPEPAGRFVFHAKVRARKGTEFVLDLGSGRNNDTKEDIVRMETRVLSKGAGVPALNAKFLQNVGRWLEMAHGITSPLFKELISADVLKNYRIGM
jgi:uncharacterized protein (TIGR04255 family)